MMISRSSTKIRRKTIALWGLLLFPSLFLVIFYLSPLSIMLVFSWLKAGPYGGVIWSFYSLNYGRIFGWAHTYVANFNSVYLEAVLLSVKLAVLTVIVSIIVCYPAAFWVSRQSTSRKHFLFFLISLPFFISQIVRLFALLLLLSGQGVINHLLMWLGLIDEPLGLLYSQATVVAGMVYIFLPFMFLPLYASVEKLDTAMIEASIDLGASYVQTFWRILLPATAPGIFAGSIIVFIPTFGNFIVPSVLGGSRVLMIGSLIEHQFIQARDWPFGAALGMLIIMAGTLVFLLFYVYKMLAVKRYKKSATGRDVIARTRSAS